MKALSSLIEWQSNVKDVLFDKLSIKIFTPFIARHFFNLFLYWLLINALELLHDVMWKEDEDGQSGQEAFQFTDVISPDKRQAFSQIVLAR